MHCKYLPVVPYNALENFSKAMYGATEGTYSAHIFRPVMERRGLARRKRSDSLAEFFSDLAGSEPVRRPDANVTPHIQVY